MDSIAQNSLECEQAYELAISGKFPTADEAIAFLERFQEKCAKNLIFQSRLAALYFIYGRVDEAEKLIQEGLSIDPTHKELLFSLGDIRLKQRDLDAVVAIASRIIEFHPEACSGYYLMQLGLIYAGRYEESIPYGREAMKREEMPAFWLNESVACFQTGRYEQCAQSAYHAIQLDPKVLENRWGMNEAIYALGNLGRDDEALKLALRRKEATENWQDDPVFMKALTLLTT